MWRSFVRGPFAARMGVQAIAVSARSLQTARTVQETMPIRFPALSPTMQSGNLVEWHKREGDEVAVGDVLFEMETDKATMSAEATEDGFLAKILVQDGAQDVKLNALVALMTEERDEEAIMPDDSEAAGQPEPTEEVSPQPEKTEQLSKSEPTASGPATTRPISPAVRHWLSLHHLDASSIPASGPKGYLLKGDVIAFIESGGKSAAPAQQQSQSQPQQQQQQQKQQQQSQNPTHTTSTAGGKRKRSRRESPVDIPASNMRKTIARRLTESKSELPHAYALGQANISALAAERKRLIAATGIKFSLNDVIIKAAALTLRAVPTVNSIWSGSSASIQNNVDISIAVATDSGLITPIVSGPDHKSVYDISSTFKELVGRAREGKLAPHEYQGGTFSISNLGMYGISNFTAVINPPQTCILAIGSKMDEPSEDGPKEMLSFQLSADERVVSQDVASRWLAVFRAYLENPSVLLSDAHFEDLENY